MNSDYLQVHHYESISQVNGPGKRAVLWVQGCKINCPGCFNPQTHSTSGGYSISVEQIANQILENKTEIEGLTISGGEPLEQELPLVKLLAKIKTNSSLSTLLFTGYEWKDICKRDTFHHLTSYLDVIIAGPYKANLHQANQLIGSTNQSVHLLSSRYTLQDIVDTSTTEIILDQEGIITLSGIDPVKWRD